MAKGKRQRPQPAAARELVALGTGSQVPTRHRNHNGYLLRWDDKGILFDPGEGTQRQMIYSGVTTSQIHTVLITHFHGDHCLGLAGLHQRISLDRVPHTVSIHYPKSGERFYKRLRYASIYHEAADIKPCPIAGEGVIESGPPLEISALKLDHGVETFGYRLVEPDGVTMLPEKLKERGLRGPVIKKLINEGEVQNEAGETVKLSEVSVHRPGQKVAFVMDTRLCDNAFELAKDVDMLVCESTYLRTETREARDHGHLTALQAARIAKESNARLLILTHFSQRYPSNKPFVEEANELHPNVVAVRDTDRVAMPKRIKAP